MTSFTEYVGYDACRCDNAVIFEKETPVEVVMKYCLENGHSGFSRNSLMTGRGKFYVRSHTKDSEHLRSKLRPHPCATFWIKNQTTS